MRNAISCQTADALAGRFLRFCADATKGGALGTMREDGLRIRKFIFNPRNLDRFQNLCLFALVDYAGRRGQHSNRRRRITMVTHYLYGTILTGEAVAANNRGDNIGNTMTLQKVFHQDDLHTSVSAEAIRFALRYRFQLEGLNVNRSYDPEAGKLDYEDEKRTKWDPTSDNVCLDDDLMGFMDAEAAKQNRKTKSRIRLKLLANKALEAMAGERDDAKTPQSTGHWSCCQSASISRRAVIQRGERSKDQRRALAVRY